MTAPQTQSSIARDWKPSAEFRYFIYDPNGDEFTYYRSVADRDADSTNIIAHYLDDGWDEDVENIVAGEISHTCEKTNVRARPPEDEIDGEGYDQDGDYWAEEWDFKCGYELQPLAAKGSDA